MGTLSKNRCPKCGGNVFLYNDYDGWYEQCLQCSHISYMDVIAESKEKAGAEVNLKPHEITAT